MLCELTTLRWARGTRNDEYETVRWERIDETNEEPFKMERPEDERNTDGPRTIEAIDGEQDVHCAPDGRLLMKAVARSSILAIVNIHPLELALHHKFHIILRATLRSPPVRFPPPL